MLEGISTFDRAAGFVTKHAGTMILAIGKSVRLLPSELVDTFYYYESNTGYVFANLRQKVWADIKNQDNRDELITQKYQEWKKQKCLTLITNPSEKEKDYFGEKTFTDIELQSNLLTNKSLSLIFKITGLFCVIYGVPTCAMALSIILSYKGIVWLAVGVTSFVFGHDFTVAGQVLRDHIDKNEVIIPAISCRSWFFFNCRPEEINFTALKEEVDKKTYLLSVVVDNIANIWAIQRTKTIMSLLLMKIPCCTRKKVEPLLIKN